MKSENEFSDIFDENFEVTYEEEPYVSQNENSGKEQNSATENGPWEDDTHFEDVDDDYEDCDNYSSRNDETDSRSDRHRQDDSRSRNGSRRKNSRGVPLAAPIKKGGKLLSRFTSMLIRQLSLLLIIATTVFVTYNFWRASTPYGDILESVRTKSITMTLAAYLCCVALFILFEIISFLWAMTRTRVHDGVRSWKEDTGRGLFSFLVVFAVSYLAFIFVSLIPDTPDVIYGIKGALNVYGSLHNTLFGLCAAGVVSCLIRRYKSSS